MSFFDGFDMSKVRNLMDKATAVVMQYGEMETKVRQVTNNDPWGSSATDMMDLARHTYNYQDFMEIMGTISKRLNEPVGSTWRQTYKALQLLEFLIINGSEQVIDDAKRRIYDVKGCQNYQYVDEKKKDHGVNIRHRATKIIDLLADDNLIREERKKAKENKSKYTGVSSTDMRNGGFGSSSSNSNNYSSSGFGHQSSTGFGSDSIRRTSGAGGGYSDAAYNSNTDHDSGYRDSSTEQTLPKVEKIETLPKPVAPPPAQPVKNLLDFDEEDEFSAFSGAPAQSSSVAANAGTGGFANFSSPSAATTAPSMQFADFGAFQQQPVQAKPPAVNTGFAEFSSFASNPPVANKTAAATKSPTNNFAAFGSISPTAAGNTFANFAPISPAKSGVPVTNAPADDFGDFADFQTATSTTTAAPSAANSGVADPIAKLVSLDAFSLSNSNPKKDPGPSLNSLRTF